MNFEFGISNLEFKISNLRSQIDFQTPLVLDSTASSRANLSVHLHSKTCLVFLCRYSIVKELFSNPHLRSEISDLRFDFRRTVETSTLKRGRHEMLPRLKGSSFDERALQSQICNLKFEISKLVEVRGFEPLTPALQTRCSAN